MIIYRMNPFVNNSPLFYKKYTLYYTFGDLKRRIGTIYSYSYEIKVCETKNSNDYKLVTDWIDKN